MRTRFAPVRRPSVQPDPRVYGTQIELDGLVLRGGVPDQHQSGAWLAFTDLEGWWEPTSSSAETTPRMLAHGGWDNRAFRAPRYITVKGVVWAETTAEVEAALLALGAAIPLDERRPFVVRRDGRASYVMARQEDQPTFSWDGTETATFDIQLSSADHRRFAGDGPHTGWTRHGPTGLPRTRGGFTAPFTAPVRSDAVTSSGRIALDLAGQGDVQPNVVVVFHGPVHQPGIRCVTTGRRLWFDIELLEEQSLEVDLNRHSVTLNGVSRRGTRRGQWITPRRDLTVEFTADQYNDDAQLTIRTQETTL